MHGKQLVPGDRTRTDIPRINTLLSHHSPHKQVRSLFTEPEWEEIQAVAKPRSNPVVPDIDIESLMSAGLRWFGSKDSTEAWLGTTMLGA